MRATGSGKSFIATAAVLMASLVIVTILAINIRLQSALTTAPSTPGSKSSSAPALQNTATPLVDIVSPSGAASNVPGAAQVPASEVSAPGAPAAPYSSVAVSPPTTGLSAVLPELSTTIRPVPTPTLTPTLPTPSGVTATTTTTAQVSPAPSSDLGDATASTGEDGHPKPSTGKLSPLVSASEPTPSPHG